MSGVMGFLPSLENACDFPDFDREQHSEMRLWLWLVLVYSNTIDGRKKRKRKRGEREYL